MESTLLSAFRRCLSDRGVRASRWSARSRNVLEMGASSPPVLLWFHESTLGNAWWGLSQRLLTDIQRSGCDFCILFVDHAENRVVLASAADVSARAGNVWHLASSDQAYKVHRNHELDGLRSHQGLDGIAEQVLEFVAPAA